MGDNLPAGWEEHVSRSTGMFLYYHFLSYFYFDCNNIFRKDVNQSVRNVSSCPARDLPSGSCGTISHDIYVLYQLKIFVSIYQSTDFFSNQMCGKYCVGGDYKDKNILECHEFSRLINN